MKGGETIKQTENYHTAGIVSEPESMVQKITGWLAKPSRKMLVLQIGLMVLAGLLRIGAANARPVVYSENSHFDELLMLEQSRLDEYFQPESENGRTMLKSLTFPWFLNVSRVTHIPFNTLMGLLWILSALCVWSMMRKWTSSRWICLFAYLFVLFCPIGFENHNAVHLYRNVILAPFLFIFFALMVSLVLSCWKKPPRKRFPWIWSILGLCLIYPAAYYIKEDGFWMRPVLIVFLALGAVGLLWMMIKRRTPWVKGLLALLCLLLPFGSFHYQTERYLDANEKAFGYRGITIRTEGPIQQLASLAYQIQSDERNLQVWAPTQVVRDMLAVSGALQSMPDFLVAMEVYALAEENKIAGDFLPWKLIYALQVREHYQAQGNIRQVMPILEQGVKEVEAAIADGRLQKQTGRIKLTDSVGTRTLDEVFYIFPDLLYALNTAITLQDYDPVPPDPVNEVQDFLASFKDELGMDLTAPQNEQEQKAWEKKKAASANVARLDFGIYRILLPFMFWGGLICWGYEVWQRRWRRKSCKDRHFDSSASAGSSRHFTGRKAQQVLEQRRLCGLVLFLVFLLVGIAVAYEFSIIWFEQFLYYETPESRGRTYWVLYYSSSMIPMLYLGLLLMVPFEKPWLVRFARACRRLLSRNSHKQKTA